MVESSAYMSTLLIVLVLMGMSFISKIKNSGPKIEPCGTPVVILDLVFIRPLLVYRGNFRRFRPALDIFHAQCFCYRVL